VAVTWYARFALRRRCASPTDAPPVRTGSVGIAMRRSFARSSSHDRLVVLFALLLSQQPPPHAMAEPELVLGLPAQAESYSQGYPR
jgi:hypothetical protein